jgi:hypothetical protein
VFSRCIAYRDKESCGIDNSVRFRAPLIEAVQMVVDISAKSILNITIIEFYGIINYIKSEGN